MNKKTVIIITLSVLSILMFIGIFLALILLGKEKTSLEILTFPDGAKILIDDKKEFISPALINVPEGKHSIKISKEGYDTYYDDVLIREGKKLKKEYRLTSLEEKELISKLPYQNMNFKVERTSVENNEYTITLYPIINGRLDEKSTYNSQIENLKNLALEWVKQSGANPDKLNIKWIP